MPAAAFGTFHSDWAQDQMKNATLEAIRVGWRHIDTARAYENEHLIGEAIKESVTRGYISSPNELFITGKLWNGHMKPSDVRTAVDNTLDALGVEKLDMYLNHWPWPNVHTPGAAGDERNLNARPYIHEEFMNTWEELVKQKRLGKLTDIGTSNHTALTMRLLLRDAPRDGKPTMNQMEMHPLFQQTELRKYFESVGIACSGYMAVGSPHRPARDTFKEHRSDLNDPVIVSIARELNVSPGYVCLNWAYQREQKKGGYVVMSTNPDRILDNLKAATEDRLSAEHLLRISGNGTDSYPGIDANNRLIWGQVFLWPEADSDWRVLWNDSQVFETYADYKKFRKSWYEHRKVSDQTVAMVHV